MKKRYVILALVGVALIFALGWSHYLWGLWGTWHGDGSLDVLGDSPLDGAATLVFSPNGTGTGMSDDGEFAFTYSVYDRDLLFLEVAGGVTHGIGYSVDGDTLALTVDETEIIYTKK